MHDETHSALHVWGNILLAGICKKALGFWKQMTGKHHFHFINNGNSFMDIS